MIQSLTDFTETRRPGVYKIDSKFKESSPDEDNQSKSTSIAGKEATWQREKWPFDSLARESKLLFVKIKSL